MNRNNARRALTGVNRLWLTQTWTGSLYWLVRTRLWRAADLAVPDRIAIGDGLTKTQLDQMAHEKAGHPVDAWRLPDAWHRQFHESQPCAAIAPGTDRWVHRTWQAIAMDESYLVGLAEIVAPAAMRVDLHRLSVSWWYDDQLVAVLLGILGQPQRVDGAA